MEVVQSAVNRLKPRLPGVPPEQAVTERIDRGRERMRRDASAIEMCWRFTRGDTYCWVDNQSVLRFSSTTTSVGGGGKEPHRVRQAPNIIAPVVRHEVAASTQRVPGYDISPSTMDPDDVAAASLAKRVAYYGYDKWSLRRVTQQVVTYAVVAKMGFAWPLWDPSYGPRIEGEDVGLGEVCVKTFGLNECYWEPGIRFEDSPWHCVEQGMTLQDAMSVDGYLGGDLAPDAAAATYTDRSTQDHGRNLVTVTHYLERPSNKYPEGRWLTLANGRVIAGLARVEGEAVTRPYPGEGEDPCIIPLSYVEDPDSDRNSGLVEHMIDAQRTYQDAWSKILEWKNRALMPQILAPVGSMKGRRTDAPGAINYYVPVGGQVPQWEKVPPIPPELFGIMDKAQEIVGRIAAQNDVPNQVEAGKAIQALIERDSTARQAFLASLAEFHSRVMRRCLALVQKHYTESRTLAIRGHSGWEPVADFKGAKLRDQIDVRVSPGSLIPMTRDAIQAKVTAICQLFPGYLSPEAAISAMENGTGEEIIRDYENHVARANRIVQRIKTGTLMDMPPTVDPATGQTVPGWMPRPFDRTEIHKHVLETFFTTEEWELLPIELQHSGLLVYDALLQIEAQQQAQQAMAQMAMAESQGMGNAAKKPMPSLPGGQPQQGGSPPA